MTESFLGETTSDRWNRLPSSLAARVAGTLALAFVALFVLQVAVPAMARLTNGFSAYYTAGRLLSAGADPARFYDDSWFQAQTVALGFANAHDIYNVNPPAAAFLLWPLASLTPVDAKTVWTALNLSFVGLALGIATRLAGRGLAFGALALALATLYQPLREEIRLGQAYALVLLLEAICAWAYVRGRDGWAGGGLGFMVAVKTAGLALPVLFLAQRRWRALGWTVVTIVTVVVATLPVVGWRAWMTYLGLLTQFGAHPELAVAAYQSLPGLALHLFRLDPVWNPLPLVAFPAGSVVLAGLGVVALVSVTFAATRSADPKAADIRSASFAAWAILSVILSPAASDYHYTLVLVPIVLLGAAWWQTGQRRLTALLLTLGVVLVGAPLLYLSPALGVGGWALLAYPKLYGGLLLWGAAIGILRDNREGGQA